MMIVSFSSLFTKFNKISQNFFLFIEKEVCLWLFMNFLLNWMSDWSFVYKRCVQLLKKLCKDFRITKINRKWLSTCDFWYEFNQIFMHSKSSRKTWQYSPISFRKKCHVFSEEKNWNISRLINWRGERIVFILPRHEYSWIWTFW